MPRSRNRGSVPDNDSPLSSELQLVRILDRTLRKRHPDGVSLLRTLEGGLVIELHRQIHLPFNPHACGKADELTEYLWLCGRSLALEPIGGITVRGGGFESYNVGRTFFKETEVEYLLIHKMIFEALSAKNQKG